MAKLIIDKSDEIELRFTKVMTKFFPEFEALKFIYVWRMEPKYTEEDQIVVASVTKMSNKDRDLWGYDVKVEVDKEAWSTMTMSDRLKTAFHELLHIKLLYEESEEETETEKARVKDKTKNIKLDKDDRVCFYMEGHDLVLNRFKRELQKFGLSSQEEEMRQFLNKVHKKFLKP